MRSNIQAMNKGAQVDTQARRREAKHLDPRACLRVLVPSCLALAGCTHVPNQFVEDGPTTSGALESDAARDLYARYQPAPNRERGWTQTSTAAQSGTVYHWPLYTEDPFEDKGTDRPDGPNKYHLGWEDYVAMPYGFSRWVLNVMAMPVSMAVQPPWKLMESDGVLSKQCLGYDHDATEAEETAVPTSAPSEPGHPDR